MRGSLLNKIFLSFLFTSLAIATLNDQGNAGLKQTLQNVRTRMRSSIRASGECAPLDSFIPLETPEKDSNWTVPKVVITPPPEDVENRPDIICEEVLEEDSPVIEAVLEPANTDLERIRKRTAELNQIIERERRDMLLKQLFAERAAEVEKQKAAHEAAEREKLYEAQENFLKQQVLDRQRRDMEAQQVLHQQLIQAFMSLNETTVKAAPSEEQFFFRREPLKDRERPSMKESKRPAKRARIVEPRVEFVSESVAVYEHKVADPNRIAIYHLNFMTAPSTLLNVLSELGPVKKLLILKDSARLHSNTAFVEYEDAISAQNAYRSLQGVSINGSKLGINWSPTKFDRRSRNLKVCFTRNTSKIKHHDMIELFDRDNLSRKFGKCLDSYWKKGSDRAFLHFNDEDAAQWAYETFYDMGFDVHHTS